MQPCGIHKRLNFGPKSPRINSSGLASTRKLFGNSRKRPERDFPPPAPATRQSSTCLKRSHKTRNRPDESPRPHSWATIITFPQQINPRQQHPNKILYGSFRRTTTICATRQGRISKGFRKEPARFPPAGDTLGVTGLHVAVARSQSWFFGAAAWLAVLGRWLFPTSTTLRVYLNFR